MTNVYELQRGVLFENILWELWGDRPRPEYETLEFREIYGLALKVWNNCPHNVTTAEEAMIEHSRFFWSK